LKAGAIDILKHIFFSILLVLATKVKIPLNWKSPTKREEDFKSTFN
jgi:hypothetical protein